MLPGINRHANRMFKIKRRNDWLYMLDCVIFLHLSRLVLSHDESHTGVTESLRLRGSMASSERESRATSPIPRVYSAPAISQVTRPHPRGNRGRRRGRVGPDPPILPGRRMESRGKCTTTEGLERQRRTRHFDRRSETECAAVRAEARNVAERVGSGSHPLLARSLVLFLTKGMRDSGDGGWSDGADEGPEGASLRFSGIYIGHVRGFCALVPQ